MKSFTFVLAVLVLVTTYVLHGSIASQIHTPTIAPLPTNTTAPGTPSCPPTPPSPTPPTPFHLPPPPTPTTPSTPPPTPTTPPPAPTRPCTPPLAPPTPSKPPTPPPTPISPPTPIPTPTPGCKTPIPPTPYNITPQWVPPPAGCFLSCVLRCGRYGHQELCHRDCMVCCKRCKYCVPPGHYGNKLMSGSCYTDMKNQAGRPISP